MSRISQRWRILLARFMMASKLASHGGDHVGRVDTLRVVLGRNVAETALLGAGNGVGQLLSRVN